MADLAYQKAKTTGQEVAFVAAAGGGDTVPVNEHGALLVRNADAAPKTVTVVVPGKRFGQNLADIPYIVDAGDFGLIGPFPSDLADPIDGKVHITYSGVGNVSVAAIII